MGDGTALEYPNTLVQKDPFTPHEKGCLYRHCISDALSIWDSTTVNNSKSAPALFTKIDVPLYGNHVEK